MFSMQEKKQLKDWYHSLQSKKHCKNEHSSFSEREKWIEQNPCSLAYKIEVMYNSGHGYKTIGKELNLSYSVIRKLCNDYIKFKTRKGTNVITEELKNKRRLNALGEKSNFFDWPKKRPQLLRKNGKSIQGYYVKQDGTKVWLRSTYEYIIAKWLDKNKFDWKVEVQSYKLLNGENYRPDFFVYEKGKLQSIIEVKSRYFNKDNREYKFHMLKEQYNLELQLITDITKFTNKTYHQELKEWKKLSSVN